MDDQQVIKRKKGRPKKIKTDENIEIQPQNAENIVKEMKKRGRKKKEVPIQQEEVVKQKKKRGRKAAIKYFSSSIRKKIPLATVIKDNDNYILHIDIKDEESQNVEVKDFLSIDDKQNNQHFKQTSHKNYVIDSLPKEIKEILNKNDETEDDLLLNLIDSNNENNSKNIKELYEKRVEFREKQDEILSLKLDEMHKDETFINTLIEQDQFTNKTTNDSLNNNHDEFTKTKIKIQDSNKKKGYFEILYDFIHNKEWVQKTDVCCWWCCHQFDNVPLGLPIEYKKKINKFMVKGVFCSFSCMIAYKNDKKLVNNNYLVNYLYTKLTSDYSIIHKNNLLKPAPPRCSLKMFGGELSIDEFRNSSSENKIYKMIEYPMCMYNDYVEEVDIANMKNANSKLFNKESISKLTNLDDKRVYDAQTRISQLESTVVTTGNTIDKFIKFL